MVNIIKSVMQLVTFYVITSISTLHLFMYYMVVIMVSRSTRTVKMLDTLIVRKVEVLLHATSILLDIPLEYCYLNSTQTVTTFKTIGK